MSGFVEKLQRFWPIALLLLVGGVLGSFTAIKDTVSEWTGSEPYATCVVSLLSGAEVDEASLDDNVDFMRCLADNRGKIAIIDYQMTAYGESEAGRFCDDGDVPEDSGKIVPLPEGCQQVIRFTPETELYSVQCGSPCYEESVRDFFTISNKRGVNRVTEVYTLTPADVPFDVRQSL
ncbi:MAG: hypothetical protein ACSHWS_07520 [Sulfitobacter sp.]